MIRKALKLVTQPRTHIPRARKMLLQKLCPLFRNASFFLQGQMDIHPASRWYKDDFARETGGFLPREDQTIRNLCHLEPWDNTRRDMLLLFLRTIVTQGVEGDLAEIGVYRGYTAKLIHHYLPDRELHLFDTFEGFTSRSVTAERENTNFRVQDSAFSDTSVEDVLAYVAPQNDRVHIHCGYFPDSVPNEMATKRYAFVHLDADLYEPTLEGLRFFYPRMNPHGMFVVHDYNAWRGARKAVDDFFADKKELPVPMPDKSGSVLIVRAGDRT